MRKLIVGGVLAAIVGLTGGPLNAQPQVDPTAAPKACPGTNGLSYICNVVAPEDLKVLPGTKWMIASGMVEGAGIKLVDTRAKTAMFWNTSPQHRSQPDKVLYPACAGPIEPAKLNSHGLSLRPLGDGRYKLLVVAHGGRESIEVYTVDPRPAAPTLTWVGCIMAPDGVALNSVTSFADGAVIATSPLTGKAYQWTPRAPKFAELPGAVANRINGIDITRDEKGFYAAALPDRQIVLFERGPNAAREVKRSPVLPFTPDNVAWDGERLIAAGGFYDDPSCPRPPPPPPGQATPTQSCYRGYVVAQFDPATLEPKIMAYADANPDFGAVAIAVVAGEDLWLSSARSDRIAWRRLPKPQ